MFLFVSHGFCRVDVWDKETWTYKHKDTDEKCGDIKQEEGGDIDFHWCLADIICGWVERYERRLLLEYDDGGSDDVADDDALADDEDSKP